MPLTKEPNAVPIPGYRLLEPLGRGGFGEVWKCEAPGGLFKAIKFVEGDQNALSDGAAPASEELQAIQLVKSIRHPFLLSMERVETIAGELVIVMELADRSLLDLLAERQAAGQPGIERGELLGYLREAADVLDLMNLRHGLQHLDIKPGNLFLVSGHVKVADFGLVRNVADRPGPDPALPGALSPRYAAPELFRGATSPSSDQYSLAIVYQELLTGAVPFDGKNARALALQHNTEAPDLSALPASDRAAVARALSKDPRQRFATCTEFIQALQAGRTPQAVVRVPRPSEQGFRLPAVSPLTETASDLVLARTTLTAAVAERTQGDYEYLECVSRSPSAEVWEARAPEGHRCLVKFLYGITGRDPRREADAVQRLQTLRHPALPALQLLPGGPGYLVVVTERIEGCLRERFGKSRAEGQHGLPRRRLLDWLRTAAGALDELAAQHGLWHLGLTPRNLLLDGDRLLLGDFGFLPLLWHPAGQLPAQLQARYAAPELAEHRLGPRCDQYSLAVIYQEMLTGTHPLHGRTHDRLNLAALPAGDRDIVARALSDDPERRFPTCSDFLAALDEAGPDPRASKPAGEVPSGRDAIIAELVAHASESMPEAEPETWLPTPDGGVRLQCRFPASLPPGAVRLSFEGFRQRWQAEAVQAEDNAVTFRVPTPTGFWQRWLGKPASLFVEVSWTRPLPPVIALPQVSVTVRPADRAGKAGASLVKELGPALLESVRAQFQGHSERRSHERLLWAHPVRVAFVLPDGRPGDTVEGQVKDISLAGIGLYLPGPVPGTEVHLRLETSIRPEPIDLAGTCVRVQRRGEGCFEAGVLFQ